MTSRREFLGGLAAAAAYPAFSAIPDGRPNLRFGVMTDTHIGKTLASCARVRQALELFRDKGAKLVVHNGDVADHHYQDGYRAYRQVFDEVYAAQPKPLALYAYAWHDAVYYLDHPRDRGVAEAPEAFAAMQRLLAAPYGHTAEVEFGGYTFLVMPQYTGEKGFLSWEDYERRVAAACKANPDKPVFVIDHVPPKGTVYDSVQWGCEDSRRILERYPQVVALTGHVHGSIRNDRFVWQEKFTVLNSGCLFGWDGVLAGHLMPVPGGAEEGYDKQEWGVLTVDVYDDRLVVRRWDVRDRQEVDAPWVVPLPFVAATAPYRWEAQCAAAQKPMFGPQANVTVRPVEKDGVFTGFQIDFADSAKGATNYQIVAERRMEDGSWGARALCEMFSDYSRRPQDRRATLRYGMPAAYFSPAAEYRIQIVPVNAFGAKGAAISTQVRTPSNFAPSTLVWSCAEPMKELAFVPGPDKPACVAGADGFYGPMKSPTPRLVLPSGLFTGPKGTCYRLTVDVRTVCHDNSQEPRIRIVRKGASSGGYRGEYNGFGDTRSLRFMDVKVGSSPVDYDLEIGEVAGGKVRFESLRVERLG